MHFEPAKKRMWERKVPYHHRLYQRNYQGGKQKKNIVRSGKRYEQNYKYIFLQT